MDEIDCIVVGAGVVGLAVARALACAGREVVVLESADAIGTGISSRNSEVIHAGIYYPSGSLKARLCVEGKHRLYAMCASHGIGHRRCGKLIVATGDRQAAQLESIRAQAAANGVVDLQWLDASQARALEPALACTAALLSPSTGIVDSHGLMLALQGDAQAHGAMIALRSPFRAARRDRGALIVSAGEDGATQLRAAALVNCAGLHACTVADAIDGLPAAQRRRPYLCKGNYFSLAVRVPFSRLVYPVPEAAGLGVHLTLDLGGQARFGPDVEWVERIDYAVDARRCDGFYDAIRRYWPALPDDALQPAYSGIRPKLSPAGAPSDDFVIEGPRVHGVPGVVNLLGIESPGLTASLAIADRVVDELAWVD